MFEAVTDSYLQEGLVAVPYEKLNDPWAYDLNGAAGFATAVVLCLKIVSGGSCNTAPVCSSWTYMNSGTAGRSISYPLGNEMYASVQDANKMVSRMCLLFYLLVARSILVIWEQPKGSLMEAHPRFQQMLKRWRIHRTFLKLSDFGAESEKGLWLYSQFPFVKHIDRYQTGQSSTQLRSLVKVYHNKDGETKICGNAYLKASQAYPKDFGRALYRLWKDVKPKNGQS